MDGLNDAFCKIIDDLVLSAKPNTDLQIGMEWIDNEARKNNMTFYEMALIVMRKDMAERRAKEWLKKHSN